MKKIVLTTQKEIHILEEKKIQYLKASGSYCIVKMVDGSEIKLSKNLKWAFALISNPNLFVKISRTWIVRISAIVGIERVENSNGKGILILSKGEQIPIVKGKITFLKEVLGRG